jgi:hypothetical protein
LSWASCLSEASIVIKWSLLAILLACVKEWLSAISTYTDRRRDTTKRRTRSSNRVDTLHSRCDIEGINDFLFFVHLVSPPVTDVRSLTSHQCVNRTELWAVEPAAEGPPHLGLVPYS